MSTRNKTPPLLEPYLRLPHPNSQILLTGVLDASPTWLVTRLLRSVYTPSTPSTSDNLDPSEPENVSVILVSWLRDYEFWKGEARRGAGLDLSRLASQNKFAFVDGLTQLFPLDSKFATTPTPTSTSTSTTPISPQRNIPIRPIPSRGPIPTRPGIPSRQPPAQPPFPQSTPQPTPAQSAQSAQSAQQVPTHPTPTIQATLKDPSLETTSKTILHTITSLTNNPSNTNNPPKIILILDGPTTLLSTSSEPSPLPLSSLILHLRSKVHSCVQILETDSPFLSAAGDADTAITPTPLETAHAAFVVSQAHVSDWLVGLRPLDTGKARDVSGVVRACRGGAWEGGPEHGDAKELEALYFVQADGGVRVFERGEASVG